MTVLPPWDDRRLDKFTPLELSRVEYIPHHDFLHEFKCRACGWSVLRRTPDHQLPYATSINAYRAVIEHARSHG